MKTRWSRRELLHRAGAAGALLWPIVRERNASAQPAPPRFVVLYFPNGPARSPTQDFFPGAGRDWSGRTTEPLARMSPVLRARYADQVSFVRPILLNGGWGFGDTGNRQDVGQHTDGMATLLTGAPLQWLRNDFTAAGGKSLDEHLVQAGARRLYLAENPSNTREYRISWRGPNQPNNPITDAKAAYADILPALLQACGASSEQTQAMVSRAAREEALLLEALRPELASARRIAGLGREERLKLERLEEAMVEIERALAASQPEAGPVRAACPPGVPPDLRSAPTGSKLERLTLHLRVLALAVALGGHRVGLLQMDHGYSAANYNFLPGVTGTNHHGMQHANQTAQCNLITRFHMERLCDLLDQLASFPEGAGTVLDQSVVLVGSDVPSGESHLFTEPAPYLLAGGGAGRLRRGVELNERHHNVDLLATLAEILGTDSAHFRAQPGFGSLIHGLRAA